MWYTLNGGLTTYLITTNASIDQTVWATLSEGSITITFYANDTLGNEAFEDVIITKSIPPRWGGPNYYYRYRCCFCSRSISSCLHIFEKTSITDTRIILNHFFFFFNILNTILDRIKEDTTIIIPEIK